MLTRSKSWAVQLKLRWTKHFVLDEARVENEDSDSNIILTIKETKIYVPVVILLAKKNKKLPKSLSKGFKRSVFWNKYKKISEKRQASIDRFQNQTKQTETGIL